MHILHLIGTMDPAAGGPSESVRILMLNAPAEVTGEVVTLDDPNAPFLKDLPFPVHALGPQTNVYGTNPRLIPWLEENRHRFTGVMVNGLWQYIGWAAWRTLPGHKPYVVFAHGMLDPYFRRAFPLKHAKKWAYWLAAEYWILRRARRVVFTTTEEGRLAKQSFWMHQWREHIVSYGAAGPTGASIAEQKEAFFELCPAARDRRFILFLGRIHRKKGCDMLLNAFIKLAAEDPSLHLVMAGPDQQSWVPELQQIALQAGLGYRVHWPGMLDGDAKWGAFHASEVFALPSHQENFGLAVAEALACSRPALLSNRINIAGEVVSDGAGILEPDTAEGTENLLRAWIQMSPNERLAMSRRALTCFEQRYDMRKNAEAIARLFQTVGRKVNPMPDTRQGRHRERRASERQTTKIA